MYCPNCGKPHANADAFCMHCGAKLPQECAEQGSHLPPMLILAGLSAIGLIVYFVITVF